MRDKLMDVVCESIATDRCVAYCSHPHCGLVHTIVQKLIANGVTIPVRCKDCINWESAGEGDTGCGYCSVDIKVYAMRSVWYGEDFCSYGEKREV